MAARRRLTRTRATRAASEILVKIGRIGQPTTEVLLEKGATVEDALEAANVSVGSGDRVRLMGRSVNLDTKVSNNDIVTIAGGIKGGK